MVSAVLGWLKPMCDYHHQTYESTWPCDKLGWGQEDVFFSPVMSAAVRAFRCSHCDPEHTHSWHDNSLTTGCSRSSNYSLSWFLSIIYQPKKTNRRSLSLRIEQVRHQSVCLSDILSHFLLKQTQCCSPCRCRSTKMGADNCLKNLVLKSKREQLDTVSVQLQKIWFNVIYFHFTLGADPE